MHDLQARRRRAETCSDVAATLGKRLAGVHLQAQVAERDGTSSVSECLVSRIDGVDERRAERQEG